MALFDKSPSQITESDLLTLLANKEPEGKRIDYKRDAVGQGEADKKEFLYDASSFANTQGGCLVFGMNESRGVPTSLVGLGDGIDPDKEILRLEQMLRDGVQPSISGVETASVPLVNGKIALVMRIPKSWNPPHQVTFQKVFRFYARDTNGKYQIEVDELRSIFSLSGTVAEHIREFRTERIAKIVGGDAPVTLLDGGTLVLHVVPFSAFGAGVSFPLREVARSPNKFPPLANAAARNHQMTFDGLLTTSNADAPPAPQRAYTQVMRTGIIEAVASSVARGENRRWLSTDTIEAMVVRYSAAYMNALRKFGIEPPIAVLASLIGVKDMRLMQNLRQGAFPEDLPNVTLARDQYHFVETVFDSIPADFQAAAKALRGTLDHIANAADLSGSPNFDDNGNYTLKI
jgi:hypothetical protein